MIGNKKNGALCQYGNQKTKNEREKRNSIQCIMADGRPCPFRPIRGCSGSQSGVIGATGNDNRASGIWTDNPELVATRT